jgi:SAM-dependent methyltransferase
VMQVYRIAGRYEFTNALVLSSILSRLSAADIERHSEWIKNCITNEKSKFQQFLRLYFAGGTHFEKSVNRFALSIEMISALCPKGGRWFDAGSFGHDAIRVKLVRPDIDVNLAVYEGCTIYLDEAGLHYYEGQGPLPNLCVTCKKLDLERDTLPFDDNSLDIVTAFEVLEHFKFGPQNFMSQASRVLRPDGLLVLTTPNATSAAGISRILRGLHPAECPLYHRDPRYGRIHPLEYAQDQMLDLAKSYGFEIALLASINMSPFDALELAAASTATTFLAEYTYQQFSEFGEKWLLIARRRRYVPETEYPPSVFE